MSAHLCPTVARSLTSGRPVQKLAEDDAKVKRGEANLAAYVNRWEESPTSDKVCAFDADVKAHIEE